VRRRSQIGHPHSWALSYCHSIQHTGFISQVRGCGAVGRTFASHAVLPSFESSPPQPFRSFFLSFLNFTYIVLLIDFTYKLLFHCWTIRPGPATRALAAALEERPSAIGLIVRVMVQFSFILSLYAYLSENIILVIKLQSISMRTVGVALWYDAAWSSSAKLTNVEPGE